MEKTVKRSVITLNSQFRDKKYPNSSDYTTIPGFLNTGPPSFYGVESVGLLDATVVEHLDHGPVHSTIASVIPPAPTEIILSSGDYLKFPRSGIIYNATTKEQIFYNSITIQYSPGPPPPPIVIVSYTLQNLIRGYNGTPEVALSTNDDIYLVGEPYIYVRLTETSLGPFEAVELSTDNQHYNRFFAKIPIDSSRPLTQQYFSHDTKWINWKMTANPFPRIHELRVETLRYYGNDIYPYPNQVDEVRSLPMNLTLRIVGHDNKMWENHGVIVPPAQSSEDEESEEEIEYIYNY